MKRARYRSWLLGLALLSLFGLRPVSAIGPTFLIVYGDKLPVPVVVRFTATSPAGFLWDTRRGGATEYVNGSLQRGTIPNGLRGRTYLKVAIFWTGGQFDPTWKPEDASQHARLYLPTPSEPAVIVATAPYMDQPEPRPIPEDLDEHRNTLGHQVGFVAGWLLNADDLANAMRVGIPGLQ